MGVPDMKHDRRADFPRQFHLLPTDLPLGLPRAQIVVIIQADLPDGLHLTGEVHRLQLLQVFLPEALRFVGMNARRSHRFGVGTDKGRSPAGSGHVRSDDGEAGDAVFPHAVQHVLPVFVKCFFVHVTVGIKPVHYPIIAPSATPSSMLTSFRWPSLSMALRIMPWLSMPASFAGLRFEITATWRPTSSAGS